MTLVGAPYVWNLNINCSDITVAIVDSGIDMTHEDLKANLYQNPNEKAKTSWDRYGKDNDKNGFKNDICGWDFVGEDADPTDENGHGTHVAGTIGAIGNNGKGVVGVNWKTKLISLRVLDASGRGYATDILKALQDLLKLLNENPSLKIACVNMSYGRSYSTEAPSTLLNTPEYLAYKALSDTNRIILCVAAGNEATSSDRLTIAILHRLLASII